MSVFFERFGAAAWVGLAALLLAVFPNTVKLLASDVIVLSAWLLVLALALAANARLSYRRSKGSDE